MKNTTDKVLEGITLFMDSTYGKNYPWLNSPSDFNHEPLVRIADKITELTGMKLVKYRLSDSTCLANWTHRWYFGLNGSTSLNLKTICDTLRSVVNAEFDLEDPDKITVRGQGFNLVLEVLV